VAVSKVGFLRKEGLRSGLIHGGSVRIRVHHVPLTAVGHLSDREQSLTALGWIADWQVSGGDGKKASFVGLNEFGPRGA
jgi:hypothetical protein